MKQIVMISTLVSISAPASFAKTVECYCTDRAGARIELGETICMQVDGRMFMAQCQMSLNVPMWRQVNDGCMSSEVQSTNPSLDSLAIDTKV